MTIPASEALDDVLVSTHAALRWSQRRTGEATDHARRTLAEALISATLTLRPPKWARGSQASSTTAWARIDASTAVALRLDRGQWVAVTVLTKGYQRQKLSIPACPVKRTRPSRADRLA